MFNLLYIGDPHFRGTSPQNRKDDYKAAFMAKIQEVFDLAAHYQCKAILTSGDLLDVPVISDGLKMEFSGMLSRQQVDGIAEVLDRCPVDIYTTIGNHELTGYNLATFENSSLRVLEALTPKLHVMLPDNPILCSCPLTQITFTPYSGKMDIDNYGYCPEVQPKDGYLNIQVSHGMALDHEPPFERFSLIQNIETYADLILTGHDHTGYGIYHRPDGKVFVNDGSLTRIKANKNEMERVIKVDLITVGDGPYIGACGTNFNVRSIRLENQKPGSEVLDRSKIEAEQEREYAMEQFLAKIETASGKKATVNINQVVEEVAKKRDYAPDVVKMVLEKIDFCRSQKGV